MAEALAPEQRSDASRLDVALGDIEAVKRACNFSRATLEDAMEKVRKFGQDKMSLGFKLKGQIVQYLGSSRNMTMESLLEVLLRCHLRQFQHQHQSQHLAYPLCFA